MSAHLLDALCPPHRSRVSDYLSATRGGNYASATFRATYAQNAKIPASVAAFSAFVIFPLAITLSHWRCNEAVRP